MITTVIKYTIGYVILVGLIVWLFAATGHAQLFGDEPVQSKRNPFTQNRMPAVLDQDLNQQYVLPWTKGAAVMTPPLEADNITGLTPNRHRMENFYWPWLSWRGNKGTEPSRAYRSWDGVEGQKR